MDNECLRHQAFEEPVSVEELDQVRVSCGSDMVVEPVEAEGTHVDRAAGRAEDQDEAK